MDIGDLLPLAQAALQGASGAMLTPSLPELAARLEQPPLAASSAAYYDSFVAGAPPDAWQPLCLLTNKRCPPQHQDACLQGLMLHGRPMEAEPACTSSQGYLVCAVAMYNAHSSDSNQHAGT